MSTREKNKAPGTSGAIAAGHHNSDEARRRAMAAAFARPVDVGGGVVVRVRLSPRAWKEAQARHAMEQIKLAGLDPDAEAKMPDLDPEKAADFELAIRRFMVLQQQQTKAINAAEILAIRELTVEVVSSEIEGVTLEDVFATPEMVEAIVDRFKAEAEAKDKKGEAGAALPLSGQSSEAAAAAN